MPDPRLWPRVRPRFRGTVSAAVLVLLLGLVTSCTGDDEPGSPGSSDDNVGDDAPTSVELTATATVEGAPPFEARRKELTAEIGEVISGYVDVAYLGEEGEPFATFTPGAAQRASRDLTLVTGAAYDDAESVSASTLEAKISVVAPITGTAGATAFVRFVIDADDTTWTYRGRLLLTPTGKTWKIFGYDLKASDS